VRCGARLLTVLLSVHQPLTKAPALVGLKTFMATDPVLIAYTVKRSASSKRPIWTRIGQAYPHEVGAGLTVVLDSVPLDGRIVLLELDHADDDRLLNAAIKSTRKKPSPEKKR